MPFRPLAIVSGLTIGDYLLWNWSLNGNHDVLALVSGLTLPPLAIVLLWLLALTVARLLAYTTRRDRNARARRTTASHAGSQTAPHAAPTVSTSTPSASAARTRPSGKIAA